MLLMHLPIIYVALRTSHCQVRCAFIKINASIYLEILTNKAFSKNVKWVGKHRGNVFGEENHILFSFELLDRHMQVCTQ